MSLHFILLLCVYIVSVAYGVTMNKRTDEWMNESINGSKVTHDLNVPSVPLRLKLNNVKTHKVHDEKCNSRYHFKAKSSKFIVTLPYHYARYYITNVERTHQPRRPICIRQKPSDVRYRKKYQYLSCAENAVYHGLSIFSGFRPSQVLNSLV